MKKQSLLIAMLLSAFAYSQVGINNSSPKATFDVFGSPTDNTKTDGIIAPRIGGNELKAKDSKYSIDQTGAILYVSSSSSDAGVVGKKTINIDSPGYFYFDGNVWQKIGINGNFGIYTANNGLAIGNNTVTLGGALIKPTVISGLSDTNNLSITGTGINAVNIDNSTLSVDALNDRVGIGTSTPTNRLEINNGSINGAIKIVDGTQGADKVLMSDTNGVGTWRTPASIKPVANGIFPTAATSIASDGQPSPKYTGVSLVLSQGKWVINAGITMFHYPVNSRIWQHAYISTSQLGIQNTGFTHLGPYGNNTAYAGVLTSNGTGTIDSDLNFISGSSIIDVTSPTVTIYLLIENKPVGSWKYVSNAFENYFYAIPLN